jgi:hypothetical protein
MRISNVLVDLGLLAIQDIPQLPKSAREILPMVDLVLKRWPSMPVCWSVFGMVTAPVTLGGPPHRSSAFFVVLLLRMVVKYTLIYMCVCVCVFITVMENLCHYTPEPPCPQPH